MKIYPLDNMVQLQVEEASAGVLDTSSRNSAVEYGEVLAVGGNIVNIKKGDHVFVKSWAIDIITHNEKRYFFVNVDTHGIVAVVKD